MRGFKARTSAADPGSDVALPVTFALMRWPIVALTVMVVALSPSTASAAVFNVNTTADQADAAQDGVCDASAATPGEQCTLRAAIREANVNAALDRVNLPAGTFPLSSQVAATSDVQIAGAGARSTAVTGGSLSFAGSCSGPGGLCSAELSDLTVRNGGGVTSRSHLGLARVTVRDNTKGPSTSLAPFGGGVFVGAVGGLVSSNLTIADSTISANRVVNFPSFLTNSMGGGVAVVSVGTVTITNSTIAGNTATGQDAVGGGIGSLWADVSVRSSTIAGNTATATTDLASGGNLYRSTEPDAPQPGSLVLRDSIVSGGRVSGPGVNAGANCSPAAVTSESGRNIDSGSSCGLASPSLSATEPLLESVGDHGGPTDVAPPTELSPALNAALAACQAADQRGVTRPQGGACDVGAVERVPDAAWTNPFPVSSVDGDADSQAVGIDAAGNAIVAFRAAGGGLSVNNRAADGTIGKPVAINHAPAGPPSIATNASGLSAIAWQQSDGVNERLHLRLRRPTGAFTVDTIVSQAGVDVRDVEVGIDDAGDAFVSWGATVGGVDRTFMRMKSTTGTLRVITAVSPSTGSHVAPHLAVEPGGRAYMTWITEDGVGSGRATVSGRTRSTTGALSSPMPLSGTPAAGLMEHAVSLDGSGKALVAWSKSIGGEQRIEGRTRAVNGSLTPIMTLSAAGASAGGLDAAMAAAGDAGVVAWSVSGLSIVQSRRIVAGAWQPVEDVSPPGMLALGVRVGVNDDASRTTFVFATLETALERVRARTRHPDGSYGAADIVSSENGLPAGPQPALAVNASGQAAAAWLQQRDSTQGDLVWVGTNFR